MSTTVVAVYTASGFLIAADGRCTQASDGALTLLSDSEQKIFKVDTGDRIFAYALTGSISGTDKENRAVNLVTEAAKEADVLSSLRFGGFYDYAKRFSNDLNEVFARTGGPYPVSQKPSELNTIGRIIFLGYFGKQNGRCIISRFWHENQVLCEPGIDVFSVGNHIVPGWHFISGSGQIARLMYEAHDPRFAQFATPMPDSDTTLEQAAMFAAGFIQACTDNPIAIEIDPDSRETGGRIHIATVSPSEFRWMEGFEPSEATSLPNP